MYIFFWLFILLSVVCLTAVPHSCAIGLYLTIVSLFPLSLFVYFLGYQGMSLFGYYYLYHGLVLFLGYLGMSLYCCVQSLSSPLPVC